MPREKKLHWKKLIWKVLDTFRMFSLAGTRMLTGIVCDAPLHFMTQQ